jgi:nucleoside-diphosphate-sugar epimerase
VRAHVEGTATVLAAMAAASTGTHLLLASSAEAYAKPVTVPVGEDHPLRARSPYGVAKIAAEGLAEVAAATSGLRVTSLRLFSVYGSRSTPFSVVGRVLEAAQRRSPITVTNPTPVRDFVYVGDVAAAFAAAARHPPADGRAVAYNVGTGIGTFIGDMAAVVAELSGAGPVVTDGVADRPSAVDVAALVADVERIGVALGWRATTPLREGLERCLREGSPTR